MPPGYHGCYLRIDLSVGRAERVSLPDAVLRQYLGASGPGAALLLEEGAAAADPVSPEAPVAFASGPPLGGPPPTSPMFPPVRRRPPPRRPHAPPPASGLPRPAHP